MLIKTIPSIKKEEKTKKIDFALDMANSNFLTVNNGKLQKKSGLNKIGSEVSLYNVDKCYYINGKKIIYSNGNISEVNSLSTTTLCNVGSGVNPILLPILYNNQKKILLFTTNTTSVIGLNNLSLPLIQCDTACLCYNRIFTAKDSQIKFGDKFNYVNNSHNLSFNYYINIDESYGKIISLQVLNDKLYVICKNKILQIIYDDENFNFELKEVKTIALDIENNTIRKCGKYIVFFSNKNIYTFDGNDIQIVKFNLLDGASNLGLVISVGNYYLRKCIDYENRIAYFCFNVALNEQFYISNSVEVVTSQMGEYIVGSDKYEYTFSPESEDVNNALWQSKKIFFDSSNTVTISEIISNSAKDFSVSFSSGNVSKTVNCLKGNVITKCNIPFNNAVITISSTERGFNMNSFELKYILRR